jgi:multiple sugar transport system permease protein
LNEILDAPRMRRFKHWREYLEGYLIISPWLIGFIVLAIGPMLASLILAFTRYDLLSPPRWTGFANLHKAFFVDDVFLKSIFNTLYITLFSVPIRLLLALFLAKLLDQKLRAIGFFRSAFYVPSVVPTIANVLIWLYIMQPQVGLANHILRSLGLPPSPWLTHPSTSRMSIAIMLFWYFGPQMLVFLAALQGVPQELYEAAEVDGAPKLKRFWHITLPMISPAIFFNTVVITIDAFQVFVNPYVATQGGPSNSTMTIALHIYQQAFNFQRMGYASCMAWLLFIVVLIFTLIQFRFSSWVYYETDTR